jgi:hypothetical protein
MILSPVFSFKGKFLKPENVKEKERGKIKRSED